MTDQNTLEELMDPLEAIPRDELVTLQEERLLEAVRSAYEHSDFIRQHWQNAGVHPRDIRSIDDYVERAPFIEKDSLRDYRDKQGTHNRSLFWCDLPDQYGWATTSGTTGDPTGAPLARAGRPVDRSLYSSGFMRHFWAAGARPGDLATMFFFTFRGPVWVDMQRTGAVPIFFDHNPAELARMCRTSLELRPRTLYLLSTPLILGLETLEATKEFDLKDVFGSYAGVSYGGEPLGGRARGLIDRWGIALFMHTAVGDVTTAFECGQHDGCHVPEDDVFVEHLVPDSTDTVAEGDSGELVVTALDTSIPLLRYRSDDIVRSVTAPCACGRTGRRIWTLGRKGDELVVDGKSVLPLDIWAVIEGIEDTSSALFQIVRTQRQMDRLQLRVGYRPTAKPLAQLRTQVIDAIHSSVGIEPEVELVANEELLKLGPPHKIPRVVKG